MIPSATTPSSFTLSSRPSSAPGPETSTSIFKPIQKTSSLPSLSKSIRELNPTHTTSKEVFLQKFSPPSTTTPIPIPTMHSDSGLSSCAELADIPKPLTDSSNPLAEKTKSSDSVDPSPDTPTLSEDEDDWLLPVFEPDNNNNNDTWIKNAVLRGFRDSSTSEDEDSCPSSPIDPALKPTTSVTENTENLYPIGFPYGSDISFTPEELKELQLGW